MELNAKYYISENGNDVEIPQNELDSYTQNDVKKVICLESSEGKVLQCDGVIMGKTMYLTDESQISNYIEVDEPKTDDIIY